MSVRCWARAGWSCGGGILRSFGGWGLRSVARPALRGSPPHHHEVPAVARERLVVEPDGDGEAVVFHLGDLPPVAGCPLDAVTDAERVGGDEHLAHTAHRPRSVLTGDEPVEGVLGALR